MKTKRLFILISDSGDGSQSLSYTFDGDLVTDMSNRQEELDDEWQSGDGLQYSVLIVPADFTYSDLGLSKHDILSNPFEEDDE